MKNLGKAKEPWKKGGPRVKITHMEKGIEKKVRKVNLSKTHSGKVNLKG
jgi:hypothetical protein